MSIDKAAEPFEVELLDLDPFDPKTADHIEKVTYESTKDVDQGTRDYLERRQNAYKAIFRPGMRSQADIDIVLRDLALFCRAGTTRYHADPVLREMLEGRAEVFLRIWRHTGLTLDQLYALSTDAQINGR